MAPRFTKSPLFALASPAEHVRELLSYPSTDFSSRGSEDHDDHRASGSTDPGGRDGLRGAYPGANGASDRAARRGAADIERGAAD